MVETFGALPNGRLKVVPARSLSSWRMREKVDITCCIKDCSCVRSNALSIIWKCVNMMARPTTII